MVAWLVAVLPPVAARDRASTMLLASVHFLLAARVQRRGALSDARLSPVQPLLHRHAARGQVGRHRARARRCSSSGAAPRAWCAPREEVIRLAIEEALIASHRHVFGVLLLVPAAARPERRDPLPPGGVSSPRAGRPLGGFGRFADSAFELLEWPAVRLTAAAFAVVGDFEDAVYCWRTQARSLGRARTPASCSPPARARWACAWACRCRRSRACSRGPSSASASPPTGRSSTAPSASSGARWCVWVFVLLVVTIARLL